MKRTSIFLFTALATGCAGAGQWTVNDTELVALEPSRLEPIEQARSAERTARQELETRRAQLAAAQREVHIAEYAIQRAQADLEIARLRFEAAQETRDADAMVPAKTRRAAAEQELAGAQAELVYREAAQRFEEQRVREGEANLELARAALEEAKLAAVLSTQETMGPAEQERRSAFEAQRAKAQLTLAEEKTALARLQADMDDAQKRWQATARGPLPIAASPTKGDDKGATSSPVAPQDAGSKRP